MISSLRFISAKEEACREAVKGVGGDPVGVEGFFLLLTHHLSAGC